jgi:prolyl-tRNA synthetase
VEKKAIEVGNNFELKTKFSSPYDLSFKNEKGEPEHVVMGCYGIGLGRLMGTVVEVLADEKGMIWPEAIAPFRAHIISLGANFEVQKEAQALYDELNKKGIEAMFDDRSEFSAGEKFADADLIGIPWRIVVSDKSLKAGGYEIKGRTEGAGKVVAKDELLKIFK